MLWAEAAEAEAHTAVRIIRAAILILVDQDHPDLLTDHHQDLHIRIIHAPVRTTGAVTAVIQVPAAQMPVTDAARLS